MQLKLFYDSEYFHFIRDFVSQFKNTISVNQGANENSLYFSKSDSESTTQKRLVQLTEDYSTEKQTNPSAVDSDKYINASQQIVSEGESRLLDIY